VTSDADGNPLPLPPQGTLGHEGAHTVANATGTWSGDANTGEQQAMGTGSLYSSSRVSEDSLRGDLTNKTGTDYGERATHSAGDAPDAPGLRPGGY